MSFEQREISTETFANYNGNSNSFSNDILSIALNTARGILYIQRIWHSERDIVQPQGYGTVRKIWYNWGDMVQLGDMVQSEGSGTTGGIWYSQRDMVQLGGDMVQSEGCGTEGYGQLEGNGTVRGI